MTPAGALVCAWACGVMSVEIEAIRRSLRNRRAPVSHEGARAVRVLVVRPCAGHTPWLSTALASLAGARRSFPVVCRIAVASTTDGAHDLARAAADALADAGVDASVVITAARGPNLKAAQLAAVVAAERAQFDVVLVADSDVDLTGADLDALVAPLAGGADIGATWAPPVEVGPERTFGDRASASLLCGSLHAFPLLSRIDRDGLVGKLFAVRRDALAAAGGFGALVSRLGEDVELARRLHAAGHRIEVADLPARSLACGRTWEQVQERIGRWITVIRAQRSPLLASYPLLFFATLPIALLAPFGLRGSPALAAVVAGVALLTRVAVALAAARSGGRAPSLKRAVVDAVLADVLLAGAFLRSLRSRRVVWCDVALTVDRGGHLRLEGPAGDRARAS